MIRGNPQESQGDYLEHPEGRFNGIVYAWKYTGERTDRWGNKRQRAMIRIESIDEIIPDGEFEGRPFTLGLFHNVVFGNPKKRQGTYMPSMQKLREIILDKTLKHDDALPENSEWFNFNPNELMGVRVRYRVTHTDKEDGSGDKWVNGEIIERLEDQAVGTQSNDTEVVEPPGQEGEQGDASQPPASTSQGTRTPLPPGQKNKSKPHPQQISYAVKIVGLCVEAGIYSDKDGADACLWLDDNGLSLKELQEWFPAVEKAATKAKVKLPTAEIHPMSAGSDDLPF